MSNYNSNMDLSKLSGFGTITLTGKSGVAKKCAVIPIEENNIFIGEKGVYLPLVFIESNNSQYGDTHFFTRGKSKAETEKEKESGERLRLPILGNLKPFGNRQESEGEEYTYPTSGDAAKPQSQAKAAPVQEEEPNLPF